MPLIRIAEMYLIKSEAQFRLNNPDAALATVNVLRKARNLPAITEWPSDFDLAIIQEYRRELIGEGQLFFLYKRLNRPMIQYSDVNVAETKAYTFPLPITETEAAQREDNR